MDGVDSHNSRITCQDPKTGKRKYTLRNILILYETGDADSVLLTMKAWRRNGGLKGLDPRSNAAAEGREGRGGREQRCPALG